METKYKNLILLTVASLLYGQYANAGKLLDESTMDQYAEQSQGSYQPMNLNYMGFNSLGMIQGAWQDPLQNLGEGQSKPAYSKYYWSPDLVLPIRVREGMLTVVNFPEWEVLQEVYLGNKTDFRGDITDPSTLMVYPRPGANVGVDTNLIVTGRSGNKYVFYVRSEGVNTERLTNSIIDIDVADDAGASGGRPSSSSGILSAGGSRHVNANGYMPGNSPKSVDATFTRRFLREDWIKSIPLDPTKFKFDIEIYVPNPDDVIIAPERVWHDDIFTYIDLGEKALNMVQRPIVTLIVERSETPVGFRTKGPNNRLIIVEGVGDMVMRNGKRMVCLKMRRSDEEGLQYVTYAHDDNAWDVGPKIPDRTNSSSGSGANGSSGSGANDSSGKNDVSQYGVVDSSGGVNLGSGVGFIKDMNSDAGTYSASGSCMTGVICNNIDMSKMSKTSFDGSLSGNNPYSQYKYGSAFNGQSGENLSIELGTDDNVHNLEKLWKDLSGRYSTQLNGYEPFYSVDTPADGQGKELFHLRVGPVKSLENGDAVCSQLGRNGVFCSVIRVQ